ncbi:MAG: hypothetical protein H7Z42_01290 [Roseiflexaceae bacterium]|nr:hypothetical protein [Roseiflexaceae bacterium]
MDSKTRRTRRSTGAFPAVVTHAAALGLYLALGLLITFPLATRLDREIIANAPGSVDGYLGIWNIWWTSYAVTNGHNPFATPLLFFPQGLDLFWQTLSLPGALLAVPLTLLVGPLPAYNMLILAGYVLGGYGMFLFARNRTGSTAGAIVAGVVFSLAPFHLQKVVDAQLEVASIQWVPFFLLVFHRGLDRLTWPWALASGVLLLVVGLGTWYYGLFCLIYTGIASALWAVAAPTWRERRRILVWGIGPVALWFALMAPRLITLAREGDRLLGSARDFNAASSADLVAFFLPSPLHPIWGQAISTWYLARYPDATLWNVSFGIVGLTLALIGLVATARREWRWLIMLVITMVLAMGESLNAFGVRTGLPLPYALLAPLPGIRSSHRPNHIVLLSIALVALYAAYGIATIIKKWSQTSSWTPALAIVLVVGIDGWGGVLPMHTRPVPAFYATLPPPSGGAILPIPTNLNVARSEHLWYQTHHAWPIFGGFIGREPPYAVGLYAPGFRDLRFELAEHADIVAPGWPESARDALAAYDTQYIVMHTQLLGSSQPLLSSLIREIGLTRTYRDDEVEVFTVPAGTPRRVIAYTGAGWGALEQSSAYQWRWLSDEPAELYLYNPFQQPQTVTLLITALAYNQQRPLTLLQAGQPPATFMIAPELATTPIRLVVPPGEHRILLQAPAAVPTAGDSRSLSIAMYELRIEE